MSVAAHPTASESTDCLSLSRRDPKVLESGHVLSLSDLTSAENLVSERPKDMLNVVSDNGAIFIRHRLQVCLHSIDCLVSLRMTWNYSQTLQKAKSRSVFCATNLGFQAIIVVLSCYNFPRQTKIERQLVDCPAYSAASAA